MPRRTRRGPAQRPMTDWRALRILFGCAVFAVALCSWVAMAVRAAEQPGEHVYEQHCRRCHGAEGRGTSQAPSLVPFDWTDEEALDLIRHPRCNMPPIPESAVSDAQVKQIIDYLKTIK